MRHVQLDTKTGHYRAVLTVPADLHETMGVKRLSKVLEACNPSRAETEAVPIVAGWKEAFAELRGTGSIRITVDALAELTPALKAALHKDVSKAVAKHAVLTNLHVGRRTKAQ
jgi:hypothetical protein